MSHRPSQDEIASRNLSITVMCPDCHAPANTVCTRIGPDGQRHQITNYPAHPKRIKAARDAQTTQEDQ